MTLSFLTRSVDDTRRLAAGLAPLARAGDVILLAGELGAGKTAFVQGFARAMGVDEHVTSPTFTLMHTYSGRLQLLHVDVYRLDHLQEIIDLGLAELVDADAVALIEWGDMAEPVLPADFLEVRIEYGKDDDERAFSLRPVGSAWGARARAVHEALAAWARP
ncbi:MAG: tRNA threonylcarbamoyladenosine biosynthesis protein TsaE [uncultured Acidimicrobiales bacterium]|uniref:tRNA threonylcarbamoyladenosine biosynthesis protein TsaE n=1 Tax=uncultured Acidimicrobiales bacterium TaxID=310071 RepID=A0A6J4J262_9ACTN|nr:MAG: tRNA threonylcarbamoyladenosine biosynthesis protein TsaE [uncultured Acidimicrobiales bacterium]